MLYWISPLEQFQIVRVFHLAFFNFELSLGNALIFLYFIYFILFSIFSFFIYFFFLFPGNWQFIFESLFTFIKKDVILTTIDRARKHYGYFFLYLFIFLLTSNLISMIPYSFALTSHISVTFTLSLIFFIFINLLGLREQGFFLFNLFLPSGTPFFISPLLILIELISYIARVFSLAIRLFANIMSGHTLLHILANFGWLLLIGGGILALLFFFPSVIIFLVSFLETAIGFLQGYVFTILCCNYFKDVFSLH